MKKLILFSLILCGSVQLAHAQIRYDQADPTANISYVGKQLPSLKVIEWLTKKPTIKGKYQLIDFWAIFAYPATSITVPHLNKLYKKFKKEVAFIGYCTDLPFYVRQIEDPVFDYPVASIDGEQLDSIFHFDGFPVALLVNPQGKVIWQGYVLIPDIPIDSEEIMFLTEQKLRELIDADKKANAKSKKK